MNFATEQEKRIIDSAETCCRSAAQGLQGGDHVAIEHRGSTDHDFELREGVIDDQGRMIVGGCLCSSGMLGRVLSKPYRYGHVDHPIHIWGRSLESLDYITMTRTTTCIFADGTVSYEANDEGTVFWLAGNVGTNAGDRCKYPALEAILRTPTRP